MIMFLFPRWDMLVLWRVEHGTIVLPWSRSCLFQILFGVGWLIYCFVLCLYRIMSSPDSVSIRWWSFKNPLFKPWILCKCARVETPNIISHILEDGHQPNSRGLYTHCKESLLKVCLKHFSSPAPSKIDWIPRIPRLLKLHISCYLPSLI